MEDLEKRALHTFLFLSGSSLFFECAMRFNGANYPQNPSWGLIHSIFEFFAGIWIIGFALWATYAIFDLLHRVEYARNEKARKEIEHTKCLERKEREEIERSREDERKAQMDIERQKKLEEDKIESLRIENERLEIRLRRSPTGAIDAAFAEFLKGGL